MPTSIYTIEIFNFKSFSGRTIIRPIQPFTAIIGPNGSGKSNIIDAISFALGEKPSALRVGRLSELIRGRPPVGVPIKDNINVTYVKVVFDVDGGTRKSFTRKIYGKDCQYIIDDEAVTKVFYMSKLREMGLDINAENFLIPQGYIECFIAKDLTAMFEKTSNSIMYKAEYDRLKLKLSKAEEEVNFQHQMKKLILIQKKDAIIEKAQTDTYLELKKEYNKTKLEFQLIRLLLIKKESDSLQDEKREIELQIDKHLSNKGATVLLLERTKPQCQSLRSSLENFTKDILEKENIIQQRKVEYVSIEDTISLWQKRRDHARVSLDSASKAYDAKERTIQELKDELKQINNRLAELKKQPQISMVELSNSQVKRYEELRNEAGYRAAKFVEQINSLMCAQEKDRDKLDNENRRKQELENKVKLISLRKENLETRLTKLQHLNAESKATLVEKTAKIQGLNQKITEISNESSSLTNDIAKIIQELSQANTDNNMILQQIEKNETIKMFKQLCSGVYGRLSDLCKPIHPRYNVAITKVFGKNMDAIVVDTRHTAIKCIEFLKERKVSVETFLPLDSIKSIFLKEQLRTIQNPKNVKLLYDVLNISSPQINKAVLFVTKNTLVCETAEDARIVAHVSGDKQGAYDCVSLDGCFFRKDGTISGGQADLIVKAKQWENQQILTLEKKKEQLMQKFRELPKISLMQSDLDIINVEINGLVLRNKYIEKDIKDTEDEIVNINEELDVLGEKLIVLNMAISEIQGSVQNRDKDIKNQEKHVNAIKDEIFVNFCKDINVPNISYYEKNNLRIFKEQEQRQEELKQQYDRIENQLCFENKTDIESKMLTWKHAEEQADAELDKVYWQKRHVKITIERDEEEMSKLKNSYTKLEKNLEDVEINLAQHRSQIDVIGTLYLESQKAHIAVQRKIEQKKIECNTVLKECKMEDFIIPMSEISHRRPAESSTSSSNMESQTGSCEVFTKIDFSQFPRNICNCTEEDLQDTAKQLNENLTKIENEFENILKPNLKVDEKIDTIAQQIQEININLRDCRNNCEIIKTQFELIKAKRYKLFKDCLDRIAAEIDSIYKNLVNDTSAQAIILPDNPEEPYAGNIMYNCIAPSKGFLPLQNLSGGEKSLASLALLFAIQRYKQIPFLIMDEGDAALDNANIKYVIRFIQSQINTMQFITTSLNEMFYSGANALVGVTVNHGTKILCSKVITISLNDYST